MFEIVGTSETLKAVLSPDFKVAQRIYHRFDHGNRRWLEAVAAPGPGEEGQLRFHRCELYRIYADAYFVGIVWP